MRFYRPLPAWVLLAILAAASGCAVVPKSQLNAFKAQNETMTEKNRAQAARIENLEIHARNTEDQLMRTEEDLALFEEQLGLDRKQLVNYEQERDQLHEQFAGLVSGRPGMPSEVSGRLAEISRRYPSLNFDPQTGIAKLDTDILFDVGTTDLKPGAERVLGELVRVLNSPSARDLKVMVAGHTDDRQIAKKPVREKYPTNFHLSTGRALAVSDELRRLGLGEGRIAVAGFGPHQPIAPNITPKDRQKNRRVELFVMAPSVPVIGWTETMPSVY